MQLGLELKSKKKRKKKPVDMSRLDADLADLAATDNTQTTDKTGSSTVSTGPAPLATNVSIVGTFCYVHYFIKYMYIITVWLIINHYCLILLTLLLLCL